MPKMGLPKAGFHAFCRSSRRCVLPIRCHLGDEAASASAGDTKAIAVAQTTGQKAKMDCFRFVSALNPVERARWFYAKFKASIAACSCRFSRASSLQCGAGP
jgi:hypothetical protein